MPLIYLKTLEDEADSALAMVETSMAELQTLDAEETVAQDAPELPVDPGGKPRPRPTLRPQSVARSSGTGYSTLDSYASAWVRRNWRWPGGESLHPAAHLPPALICFDQARPEDAAVRVQLKFQPIDAADCDTRP